MRLAKPDPRLMSLPLSSCARWDNRTATWAKFRAGSGVTMISSSGPIERVLVPADVKEGYFEVQEDMKCLTNSGGEDVSVLEVPEGRGTSQGRMGARREDRNGPGSFRGTNLPSSQRKPSIPPPGGQEMEFALGEHPLVFSRSRSDGLALSRHNSTWLQQRYPRRVSPRCSVGYPGLRLARDTALLSIREERGEKNWERGYRRRIGKESR